MLENIDKKEFERLLALAMTPIVPQKQFASNRITLSLMSNQAILYTLDGQKIDWFYSRASVKDGRSIDTRTAVVSDSFFRRQEDTCLLDILYTENDLQLTQHFSFKDNEPSFILSVELKDTLKETVSNELVPLDFTYPSDDCHPLFLSLEERILLVPYDNDMWVNYETAYLRAGATSYDVSVIFNEDTKEGLLLGALDFSTFKNGIVVSGYDARCFSCISGISDLGTHDTLPHGYVNGESVCSSPFICGFYPNVIEALSLYGKMVEDIERLHWSHGTVFGWNSYSALTLYTRLEHLRETSAFFQNELTNFVTEENTVFLNLDAVFNIDRKELEDTIALLHSRNQKVGTYSAPLIHLAYSDNIPLLGHPELTRKDIVLKCPDGSDYMPIDGKLPIDITKEEAELDFRLSLREIVALGFDYLKIDFTSHGAVEGRRANKEIHTGRQALNYFYQIVREELDSAKCGREIFVSLSISPLFPSGQGHARRFSCDAFGHHEDVRYVLNALNYSYWANHTLYEFNDPDHTVLSHSMVDKRGVTSLQEARSRYNASVISGSVLLLSDNYGPLGEESIIRNARERALLFANDRELNELARLHLTFLPLTFHDTSEVYYAQHDGCTYLAVFNLKGTKRDFRIAANDIHALKAGRCYDLNRKNSWNYTEYIDLTLEGFDSAILKLTK